MNGEGVMDHDHIDAVAAALGQDDPRQRSNVVGHLLACPECRSEFDEISATVGELLAAVPAVQPPLGFEQQVLSKMGIDAPTRVRRKAGRQLFVAAAIALVVSSSAFAFISSRNNERPTTASGEVRSLATRSGGALVGTVSISAVAGESVMVVAIVAAPDGVSYSCLTTLTDGSTSLSKSWPAGNGAWIVPLPNISTFDVRTVDLVVAGTDRVWSTASFDS
ncbi:MAG: hypothetical protein ABIR32_15195 [Ilumatobacteraceae bacterium]